MVDAHAHALFTQATAAGQSLPRPAAGAAQGMRAPARANSGSLSSGAGTVCQTPEAKTWRVSYSNQAPPPGRAGSLGKAVEGGADDGLEGGQRRRREAVVVIARPAFPGHVTPGFGCDRRGPRLVPALGQGAGSGAPSTATVSGPDDSQAAALGPEPGCPGCSGYPIACTGLRSLQFQAGRPGDGQSTHRCDTWPLQETSFRSALRSGLG